MQLVFNGAETNPKNSRVNPAEKKTNFTEFITALNQEGEWARNAVIAAIETGFDKIGYFDRGGRSGSERVIALDALEFLFNKLPSCWTAFKNSIPLETFYFFAKEKTPESIEGSRLVGLTMKTWKVLRPLLEEQEEKSLKQFKH